MPLLSVRNLVLSLPAEVTDANPSGRINPVDGVSFDIEPGEAVGLVGESGSGKSLTAASVNGLTRALPGAKISGAIQWSAETGNVLDLTRASNAELGRIRGSQIGMVFQDPLSCLNPLLRVGYQIGEVLVKHEGLGGTAARRRAVELLETAGVPQPESRLHQYPHQLSGGLRQRVLLAISLAARPRLLIADEPTTALDVTIQAQIIETLKSLQSERGLAILFITHDLGLVAQLCSRVEVMYAGRIVESAEARSFFGTPSHPYSQGLLGSLPALHFHRNRSSGAGLKFIPGNSPSPGNLPAGCRFHPRCEFCTQQCIAEYPPPIDTGQQRAACWHVDRARVQWQAEHWAEVGTSK